MTELSPVAQAVLDASNLLPGKDSYLILAAVLRAAADRVEQKLRGFSRETCQEIRSIAAELESNA